MIVTVDLAVEAADEVARLITARSLVGAAGPFRPDGPLIGIARRNAVRRALGRRVLLLWRSVYEDAGGRVAESALVAVMMALSGDRVDVRHVDWTNAPVVSLVNGRCRDWRVAVQHTLVQFTSTRMARERAIAAAHATDTDGFQPGLFDRRADRAHIAHAQDAGDLSAQHAARVSTVASAGAISLRSPELLLVLVPRHLLRLES
jgi:hypothetical protein